MQKGIATFLITFLFIISSSSIYFNYELSNKNKKLKSDIQLAIDTNDKIATDYIKLFKAAVRMEKHYMNKLKGKCTV